MPNTKSAERRMRSNTRKQARNQSVKNRLRTLERKYEDFAKKGSKEDAQSAFRSIAAALDKAAKTGVIHKATADRKKSRLSTRLNKVAAKA